MATEVDGAVVGFAHYGPPRDDDLEPAGRGELYALYVDPAHWRKGHGAALIRSVEHRWRATRAHELSLWVFAANRRARDFYERMRWTPDGARRTDEFGGARLIEVRYRRTLGAGD